jgi:hypothetical protein
VTVWVLWGYPKRPLGQWEGKVGSDFRDPIVSMYDGFSRYIVMERADHRK